MNGFLADCRHGLRLYVRTPAASLIAVFVLAVAVAFVGAFLSLYVDLVLKPHRGFEQSSRLATIGQNMGSQTAGPGVIGIPHELVQRIADEMTSIEAAASFSSTSTLVGPEGEAASTGMVSAAFFVGLRPRLVLGRGFRIEDHAPDAEPVVVLSHGYWQQRFNGDRDVLGTLLELKRNPAGRYRGPPGSFSSQAEPQQDTAQFRIVGVMAESVSDVAISDPAIWVPLERVWSMFMGVPESLPAFNASGVYVRRPPGVSAIAVANELRARYEGPDSSFEGVPGARLDAIEGIVRDFGVQRAAKRQLEMFLAGSVLLALVAAANVSLFLLARAPGRRRELGIRMAVGAPIKRLARQLATEAGLLVVVSAAMGLVGSIGLTLYLSNLALLREAEWRDVTLLDWRVLSLAGVLLLILTLLVSLAPILGIKRGSIAASSHQVTARASLAQRLAGTAQIAVAGALGAAAIAFGWYLGGLMFGDPGYETADRYVVDGASDIRGLTREQIFVEFSRRREVIEAIPGVTAVAFGSPVPGEQSTNIVPPVGIPQPNDPAKMVEAYTGAVDHRFIDLLGLEIIDGRAPGDGETAGVLVNQTLARALWGRDRVVGERLPGNIRWGFEGADVLGVLADVSFDHPSAAVPPYVFATLGSPAVSMSTVIEAQLTAAELQQGLDRLTAAGTLEVQVRNVRPLRGLRYDLIAADRARGVLTIVSAALVVLLAAFGFYGTQRYLVAAGRREYAIRASLGAGPRAVRKLVLGRGLWLSLPGIVGGALLAFITVAWLRGDFLSREISPGIITLWIVGGLIFLILTASFGPAREAGRTQPAPLLKED